LDRAYEQVAQAASALVGDPGDALSAASAAAQARQEAAQELAAAADRIAKLMADNEIIERLREVPDILSSLVQRESSVAKWCSSWNGRAAGEQYDNIHFGRA
jgi:hypothetical protein